MEENVLLLTKEYAEKQFNNGFLWRDVKIRLIHPRGVWFSNHCARGFIATNYGNGCQ
jgi:hypothetical protein